MKPTREQIRTSAYDRWERRGRSHGSDRADWLSAERQQNFACNYGVVAADRLDRTEPRPIGDRDRRRCRFCGQARPRTEFAAAAPIFPGFLGEGSPIAFDHCDECASLFAEAIDPAFRRFAGPYQAGTANEEVGIAVDAFKGLVKLALSVMPVRDLDDQEDTIEWICNPDHDFDLNVFRGLSCVVHVAPSSFPASWFALARRTDDDQPWPCMLFFLGMGHVTLQIPVPLNPRDEELDVEISTVPDVLPPSPYSLDHDPVARVLLPLVSTTSLREPAYV